MGNSRWICWKSLVIRKSKDEHLNALTFILDESFLDESIWIDVWQSARTCVVLLSIYHKRVTSTKLWKWSRTQKCKEMRLSVTNAHDDTERLQAESHTHDCVWSQFTTCTQHFICLERHQSTRHEWRIFEWQMANGKWFCMFKFMKVINLVLPRI